MVELLLEELQLLELYRKGNDPQDIARAENLMEFMNSASEFDERFAEENDRTALLADFLPFVALQTDLDRVKDEDEALKLMTLHNAKGLEFEHVFIVGLEQELLPHRLCMNTREEIEEERRLLYVAMTRARTELRLIAPVRFYVTQQQGTGDRYVHGARSRFLTEPVMKRFQRVTAGETKEGFGALKAAEGPRIDVASRLRDMW